MTITYNTLSQAQTYIKVYNSLPQCKGWAKLIHAEPGVYTVEVA